MNLMTQSTSRATGYSLVDQAGAVQPVPCVLFAKIVRLTEVGKGVG